VLQIRVISPSEITPQVVERLARDRGTASVAVHHKAGIEPEGDLIIVEVARERGNAIVDALVGMDLDVEGSISLISLEAHTSRRGHEAEIAAQGHGADALMWQELEEKARSDSFATVTYYVLMMVAVLIATIAIVLDSAVLVIGAMIVGPEYAPLQALAVSLYRRAPDARRALVTLLSGLAIGIVAAAAFTAILRAVDEIPADFSTGGNFFTAFVSEPNVYSFLIAFFAGIAGTIALAQGRQAALAGVLVSVTTLPATAAIGVDAVVEDWGDALDAFIQLLINLVALMLASIAALWVHDRAWRRLLLTPRHRPGTSPRL